MKKNSIYSFIIILSAVLSFYFLQNINSVKVDKFNFNRKAKKEFNDASRKYQEFLMLRDPATNRIPENIRLLELKFAEKLPKQFSTIMLKNSQVKNVQALTWVERGPNNIGGRVRALGIDIRTTGTPTIIAGGASGGLWKSTDGGNSWVKKTTYNQLLSVTCIAQDTRSGHEDTWYYGTGENLGNSASANNATYFGNGIFKSTDNGETWSQLASTNVSDITTFNSDWQYIWNIAVHPVSGNVYAATTGGIYRSTNGGTSWTKVFDPNNSNTLKCDVTISSNGTVYTSTSSDGGDIAGIRKSVTDSETDVNFKHHSVSPTLPSTYGRTIIKVAPSDTATVYFLTEGVSGTNTTPNVHDHQFWRSSNGGSSWTNISSVIPSNTSPNLDNFSTQNGYDMLLSIKPDDAKFVIVGGVSLFKIHDVTNDSQTLAEKHIGGYGISDNGTANALGDFINHHPDNHIGVFKPGSNVIFYCGNDGGVHLANDITATASATFWETPKRNGLNISQLYHASIDKTSGSGFIAGGFQDRGNWMARTTGSLQNWQEVGGGDGAFAEIDPSGTYVFMSTTHGNIFRFLKSNSNSPVDVTTAIKPSGVSNNNTLFITPFDVDDNNGDIIYFSGGNTTGSKFSGIWRTTNATAVTPTWEFFNNSEVPGEYISSVKSSKSSSSNVLYYGTSGGKVYRIDKANSADVTTTNPIAITGSINNTGYVSSIDVDESNSANVLLTFSNYGTSVGRIWYSSDSGNNLTNVTGNLNGEISVRWAKMFNISGTMHYFLATSTGVYYTILLDGASTVWTQEATNSIGNAVVVGLDFRANDGTLIAATHGRGVFETQITTVLPVELISFGAVNNGNNVTLSWATLTEVNNYGFNIERKIENSDWEKIGFTKGYGNSNSLKSYSFIDQNVQNGKIYYRLKQIDLDGKFKYSNVIELNIKTLNIVELKQNYPNPFNPYTTISYYLPNTLKVSLVVYDATGREVATLANDFQSAGTHSVIFDGNKFASGIYYYRIQAGNLIQTRKMLLVK